MVQFSMGVSRWGTAPTPSALVSAPAAAIIANDESSEAKVNESATPCCEASPARPLARWTTYQTDPAVKPTSTRKTRKPMDASSRYSMNFAAKLKQKA